MAGSAAFFIAVCWFAFVRTRSVAQSGLVVLGAVAGAAMAWAFLERAPLRDHDADRRALEMRAEQLTALALAPGSALACLDALAGESVEAACEKALFASPASVAAATTYVAARLALVSDMVALGERGGADIDSALLPLRHSLEADHFGFLAHALAVRDGCTGQDCKALALLRDPGGVRTNLSEQTFDHYLARYLFVWVQPADAQVAEVAQVPPAATARLGTAASRKVLVNIDFPTAASIPAVSIMNPEPTGRVLPGVAAAAAANPNPPPVAAAPPRRPRKQAVVVAPLPQTDAPDPVYWPAPAAPAPVAPQAAATNASPTANFAPAAGTPVQLNPFPPPPGTIAGTPARAQ